jgi:hypothetical protein
MLEIPLVVGLGAATICTLYAVFMMRNVVSALPFAQPGESGQGMGRILILLPISVLMYSFMPMFLLSEESASSLGLLILCIGSLSLLIPLSFNRAVTWFGLSRFDSKSVGIGLLLAVVPFTIVMIPFLCMFLFVPWPAWHIAAIPFAGLFAPAALAFALPSEELPAPFISGHDGEQIESVPFAPVLIRLMILEAPMMLWFMAGFIFI